MTHYDTLGVSPGARQPAIEKAWRRRTAEEGPGSARLGELNEAAAVLLDPARRADYDAELARAHASPDRTDQAAEADGVPDGDATAGPGATRRLVALILLPVLALCAAVAAGVLARQDHQERAAQRAGAQARAVAERALPTVLSYDYRRLEEGRDQAHDFLTPRLRREFDKSFDLLVKNKDGSPGAALQTKTVVTAKTVSTGVMDADPDRVTVLAFVNQTSAQGARAGEQEPRTFANRVRVVLTRDDDRWLIEELDPR